MGWYPCDCGTGDCVMCSGAVPDTVSVTFSGITAPPPPYDDVGCTNCDFFNATFTLTRGRYCIWETCGTWNCLDYGLDPVPYYIAVFVWRPETGKVRIDITLISGWSGDTCEMGLTPREIIRFQLTIDAESIDCGAGYEVPLLSAPEVFDGIACDFITTIGPAQLNA